jgi:hypothetical protein
MANTFELIEAVTVGSGGATSIDFTSIPSTYTDLCVIYSLRSDRTSIVYTDVKVTLNGTNSSNGKVLYAINGTTTGSYSPSAVQSFFGESTAASATASTFSNGSIYLLNYTSSNNKSISGDAVTENNGTAATLALVAGSYSVTSAVNQITLSADSGNIVQYSTAYLYGVSNA